MLGLLSHFAVLGGLPRQLQIRVTIARRSVTSYLGPASSADELDKLLSRSPPSQPQVALVGRSNVGKSSLVNALLGKRLAVASKTPGRTRVAHAYQAEGFVLIDLPGYGFAKGVGGDEGEKMSTVVAEVALERERTDLVLVALDARRLNLMPNDESMVDALEDEQVSFELVFTKIDLIPQPDVMLIEARFPDAWRLSSEKGVGVLPLKRHLETFRKG